MNSVPHNLLNTIQHLMFHCGTLRAGERVLVLCNPKTEMIGKWCHDVAVGNAEVQLRVLPTASMHGVEPPPEIAQEMSKSDLIVGLTTFSMAHTHARRMASLKGARYLSLPDYTEELLHDEAITVNYRELEPLVRRIADQFTRGSHVIVKSPAGTHIQLRIDQRVGNACPGYVAEPGDLGSPPDVEANVSPIEDASEGIVVVDGSIPHPKIGLLQDPVVLHVKGGRVQAIDGPAWVMQILAELFNSEDPAKTQVLAECGVGLNPRAKLTGSMLTDEGAAGTMHFGFGSNSTVGGMNQVPFHLDFVFRNPSLWVDGVQILADGLLQ